MISSLRLLRAYRNLYVALFCAAILLAGASKAHAQRPTITNHGWPQNSIIRYAFGAGFTDEQKRQIRAAAAEWNRANSINYSKVSFVEDTSGQNFSLQFQIGALTAGNPAVFTGSYDPATGTVKTGIITYDPNNTFPNSTQLIADPAQPLYSTIVMKLVMHEMGHLMGLDHPALPPSGNVCDQQDGATVMNYACGINDQGNNLPTTVAPYDQDAINLETIYPSIILPTPTLQIDTTSVATPFDEGAGRASVVVTRSGDHTTAVSVNYATSDPAGITNCDVVNGIASSRCDYITSISTLRFASGEISKTISIPLVDDSYHEGSESFTITLSNPGGASLGSPSTATITIADNDATTGPNPIDGTDFFVRQHYLDFLNREPDPPGFRGWRDILNNCKSGDTTCDRIEVSSRFFRSAEFQERGYFIYRFYSVALGRKPNYAEFIPDLAKVSGFLTADELEANKVAFIQEFMTRQEFQTRYGSLTDPTTYVDALLSTAGLPNHPSRGTWITGLANGTLTRLQVLRQLAESIEAYNKFYTQAFVVMQYFGYLRRDPDSLYLKWIDIMNGNGGDYRSMVNGFVNSAEYRKRFGPS